MSLSIDLLISLDRSWQNWDTFLTDVVSESFNHAIASFCEPFNLAAWKYRNFNPDYQPVKARAPSHPMVEEIYIETTHAVNLAKCAEWKNAKNAYDGFHGTRITEDEYGADLWHPCQGQKISFVSPYRYLGATRMPA